jgi:hypothetical protein
LVESGKRVHVLYPIPELPADIGKIITPFSIFNTESLLNPYEVTPSTYYYERNKFILAKLNNMEKHRAIKFVKPSKIFCVQDTCKAAEDKQSVYFDDDHIGINGAKKLVETIEF